MKITYFSKTPLMGNKLEDKNDSCKKNEDVADLHLLGSMY